MIKYLGILLFLSFISCSSFKRMDDAVRIKPDAASKYITTPEGEIRETSTLRGTVVKVNLVSYPDSCSGNDAINFKTDTIAVFLDSKAKPEPGNYELVPISDIILIRDFVALGPNEYNNVNIFENYNNPAGIRDLRETPVSSYIIDTCHSCSCSRFEFDFNLKCPERTFPWYFIELRGAYSIYNDFMNYEKEIVRTSYPAELALGIRFGGNREWGIGLLGSTGVRAYNRDKQQDEQRYQLLLHARYQSSQNTFLRQCVRPYIFADFGMSVDELSLELPRFKYGEGCENCKKYIEELSVSGLLPGIDISLPLSYGTGVGIDIPLSSKLDLSFDISFRSIGFGESIEAAGFENIPSLRRIYMLIFRTGLTI